MVEPSNVRKAKIKSLDSAKKVVEQRIKEEYELQGADRLKFEISHLENVIRNCKFDLNGGFKGNTAIANKLSVAEKQLIAKQEELKGLSNKAEVSN
jgi:hypothetical protein